MSELYEPVDPTALRRERDGARELRASQWWKRRIADGVCYYCRRVGGRSRRACVTPPATLPGTSRSPWATSCRSGAAADPDAGTSCPPARTATTGRKRWSRWSGRPISIACATLPATDPSPFRRLNPFRLSESLDVDAFRRVSTWNHVEVASVRSVAVA